jgi:hypothetical protein
MNDYILWREGLLSRFTTVHNISKNFSHRGDFVSADGKGGFETFSCWKLYTSMRSFSSFTFLIDSNKFSAEVSTLSEKIRTAESSIGDLSTKMSQSIQQQEQHMQTSQAQSFHNVEISVQTFTELGKVIPGFCKLDCRNGGSSDKMCTKCEGCDDGFIGHLCHIPVKCSSTCGTGSSCECAHGGVLSAETCQCQCAAGWTGPTCAKRDKNSTVVDARRFLRQLGNSARRDHLRRIIDEARFNGTAGLRTKRQTADGDMMIPNHLGNGVDPITRQFKAPVVEPLLPRNTAPQLWISPLGSRFAIPERAYFELSPSYAPWTTDQMFKNLEDFVAYMQEERNKGVDTWPTATGSSLFIRGLDDVRSAFQKYQDSFLAMTRVERRLYKLRLDITAQAPADTFQLDDSCSRAIDFLPPTYDESTKELYTMFFDYWGTSFASAVVEGGVVESLHAVHSSSCTINGRATNGWLSDSQRQFMGQHVGLPGQWTVNNEYEAKSIQDASGCAGGNVVVCEDQLRTRAPDDAWVQSLWALPAPVSFEVHSIHEVVRDPLKKQAMLAAAQDYERTKLTGVSTPVRTSEFCPPQNPVYPDLPYDWDTLRRIIEDIVANLSLNFMYW